MSDLFQTESEYIEKITGEYVKKMIKIWSHMFAEDLCRDHLRKLTEHAVQFYEKILTESIEKKDSIENEIKNVYNEADNLRRLLNVNVNLPEPNSCEPLLIVQMKIDNSFVNLRESLRKRTEKICELQQERETLFNELNEPMRSLSTNPLPTEEQIEDFKFYLEELKSERTKRIEEKEKLKREIKSFQEILGIKELVDDLLPESQNKLSKEALTELKNIHQCYQVQVDELRDEIIKMQKKLYVLWERLNISPTMKNKIKNCNDYTYKTYGKIYAELQRCEGLKRENLKRIVDELRQEIVVWWDKLLKSKMERDRFYHFHNNYYTDDLLELHEMELDNLRGFYEKNCEIYELFAKRKMLWQRMSDLEEKASAPGHYNNRGGQLLKEEKERKTIAINLPKIEQKIRKLVLAYTESEHEPFYVYGIDILAYMSNEWEEKRINKEKLSMARKNAKISRTKRTPVSKKTVSNISASSINLCAANIKSHKIQPSNKQVPMKRLSAAKNNNLKSPRKHRIVETNKSHKLGCQSVNFKKRFSTSKKSNKKMPDSTIECLDTTYQSFQKSIDPGSRSTFMKPSERRKCVLQLLTDENERLAILPNPHK